MNLCKSVFKQPTMSDILTLCSRYLRKKRLNADRWFKASADELYRRPFDGRSSAVVVSISRMNSIRRAAVSTLNLSITM